eukprot:COSAG02_NODE_39183_length_420_cov_0.781931_1_plen_67_part_10
MACVLCGYAQRVDRFEMSLSELADALPGLKTTEERAPNCEKIADLVAADIKCIPEAMEKVKELSEMK